MHRRNLLKAVGIGTAALSMPAIAKSAESAVLRFVPQTSLETVDPIWTSVAVTTTHGYYVFDTLYSADSQMRPQPQMAEGHTVSDDGLVWHIRLREGLLFHDNTPVRGIDCAASLERWSKVDAFGQLLGSAVASWGAANDKTVEIKLKRPFPLLLQAIGKPDATVPFIMPERLARTSPSIAVTEVIGSGPYRFEASEFVSGSRVVYTKFDGYRPRTETPDWGTGAKIAYFPKIEWHIMPDPATALAALQAGEIDWWDQPLPDLLPILSGNDEIRVQTVNPTGLLSFLRFNSTEPPFDKEDIRRAVMRSVNQTDYMTAAYGADQTQWSTCFSLFPHGSPYYSEAGAELLQGSHEAADVKKALEKAGYNGEHVVILNPSDNPALEPFGQITYANLKKAGMNVELVETDFATIIQRRTNRGPVSQGGWSIFHSFGSGALCSNPAISPLTRGLGSSGWYGWWKDAAVEELVQQWLYSTDSTTNTRLATEINTRALHGAGTIPLGQSYVKTAFRKNIRGVLQGNGAYPWNVRPA
jgi:peptide/nickel transport system substrate-binding protein